MIWRSSDGILNSIWVIPKIMRQMCYKMAQKSYLSDTFQHHYYGKPYTHRQVLTCTCRIHILLQLQLILQKAFGQRHRKSVIVTVEWIQVIDSVKWLLLRVCSMFRAYSPWVNVKYKKVVPTKVISKSVNLFILGINLLIHSSPKESYIFFIDFSWWPQVRVSDLWPFLNLLMLLGSACKKPHLKMFDGSQSMLENLNASHSMNITKLNSYSKLGSCISFQEQSPSQTDMTV